MNMATYDQDLYTWALEQAALLRERKFDQIDLEHIIEEIEDMSKSEKRALEAFLETLRQTAQAYLAQHLRKA